jgi:hypothetical protein
VAVCPAGGDPFIAALYRRWQGCLDFLPNVMVHNRIGGVQLINQPYQPPRYGRRTVSKEEMLLELHRGTQQLSSSGSSRRQLAIDVVVPSARLDLQLLQGIAEAVL